MFTLEGKKALVTGASGGIGGAIAKALYAQGADVALSGTRTEKLEEQAAGMEAARRHILPCDLSNMELVKKLAADAETAMGQVDILICNAGITQDNLFMRMSDEEWQNVLTVNLTSAFTLSKALLRGMMKRRFGRIIGITSVVGSMGNPGQANYAASKAGMTGMMKSLGAEVASRGITANCIAPGFIRTAMTDKLNDAQKEAMLKAIPLGKFGEAEDIAAASVYLASEESRYITGQTLHINGGMLMV
ncbi:MAG: 3-oxoacyl-[acyl-carrier-protein] reductase [Hyphomicrobiales bacterium]|nr:3-oxoacyl-[acyl-carrier-protein] reductase [Rickettsiales bacterium]MCP5361232.1 3-oxoacyl-[acyl-carrier-protein] reductase [Hyphomicrobiales bacterium]